MPLQMRPTDIAQLGVGAGFLWPHQGQWRLYQLLRRWDDGALAHCSHPHHPHELFLPMTQWVLSMTTPTPDAQADWLDVLGHHWATSQLKIPLQGSSMWPTIPTPSFLDVLPPEGLSAGQVVLWGEYGPDDSPRWVAHRLIDLGPLPGYSLLRARGDNNLYLDPPLRPDQLLGRVVTAETAHGPRDPNSHTAHLRACIRRLTLRLKQRLHGASRH